MQKQAYVCVFEQIPSPLIATAPHLVEQRRSRARFLTAERDAVARVHSDE